MNENNKLLTIGQFADLHGINKKTLMWYDEIGLFKPAAINPENGYRYYNYHQSSLLETILLLRELNVSINEIQEFMNNRSAKTLNRLLFCPFPGQILTSRSRISATSLFFTGRSSRFANTPYRLPVSASDRYGPICDGSSI